MRRTLLVICLAAGICAMGVGYPSEDAASAIDAGTFSFANVEGAAALATTCEDLPQVMGEQPIPSGRHVLEVDCKNLGSGCKEVFVASGGLDGV